MDDTHNDLTPEQMVNLVTASNAMKLLRWSDLEKIDFTWLIHETLPSHGISIIYGDTILTKCAIVEIAATIASGREWYSRKTRQGHVVYVTTEGLYGLKYRVDKWLHNTHTDRDLIRSHFHIIDANKLFLTTKNTDMLLHTLTDLAFPVQLLVIDTLPFPIEREILDFISTLQQRLSCHLCLTYYRDLYETEEGTGFDIVKEWADTIMHLAYDNHTMTITCEKQRDGAMPFNDIEANTLGYTAL